jgi:hypothetical protein
MWHSWVRREMHTGFWLEVLKQNRELGRSRHQGDNNIEVDPEEYDGRVWNGFVCLRTRKIGELL